jgi:hypothetical protein
MQDAGRVRVLEPARRLERELERAAKRQRSDALQLRLEAPARQVLEYDEPDPLMPPSVIDANDVRMLEPGEQARFLHRPRLSDVAAAHGLQRYLAAEHRVPCDVDAAFGTLAQEILDHVVGDDRARFDPACFDVRSRGVHSSLPGDTANSGDHVQSKTRS